MYNKSMTGILWTVWLHLIIGVWATGNLLASTEEVNTVQIQKLENNPGIFYESVQDLQLVKKQWTIVTSIDITALHEHIDRYTHPSHLEIREHCKQYLKPTECNRLLKTKSIEVMTAKIIELNYHLEELFLAEKYDQKKLKRPRVPPLAIIGSIHRSLFGLMDYNDYQHLTKEIDRLYQSQGEITSIVKNSTHILRSEIENINSYLNETNHNIMALKTAATNLQNKVEQQDVAIAHIQYVLYLSRVGAELEANYKQLLETTEKIIEAIDDAKHGRITHSLLTPLQLKEVSDSVRSTHPELEFPIPSEISDLPALSKISYVQLGHTKGKLLTIISLPLLSRDIHHLYHLRSCRKPQVIGNKTLSALIIPTKPYLMTTADRQQYALLQQEDLNRCTILGNRYICLPRFAIRSSTLQPTCEIQLLLNPTMESLATCDVRITKDVSAEWTNLMTGNRWLFSTLKEETGTVICGSKLIDTIKIAGTGILTLGPDCSLRTTRDLVTSIGNLATSEVEFHLPAANLSIPDLTNRTFIPKNTTNLLDKIHFSSLPNINTFLEDERQLDESQKRLDEIGKMHQEMYHHKFLTFGTLGSFSFITILGLLYGLYRYKSWFSLAKLCRNIRTKSSDETTKEDREKPKNIKRASSEPNIILYREITPKKVLSEPNLSPLEEEPCYSEAAPPNTTEEPPRRSETPTPTRRIGPVILRA